MQHTGTWNTECRVDPTPRNEMKCLKITEMVEEKGGFREKLDFEKEFH